MVQVNIREAETQLSQLQDRLEQGEEVIVTRGGEPGVRLVLVGEDAATRTFGAMKG